MNDRHVNRPLWHRAAALAARVHEHQYRNDGKTPYAAHTSRVAMIIASVFGFTDDAILAEAPVQVGHDKIARFIGHIPSFGHSVFHIRKSASRGSQDIKASCRAIENDHVRVKFDRQGT